MLNEAILAIDLGTSKICALLLDAGSGQSIHTASAVNDATTTESGDRHEQCPLAMVKTAGAVSRQCIEESGIASRAIRAVAITGQMHGVLLMNADGVPVTPLVTWRDGRTAGSFLEAMRARLPEGYAEQTGCRLCSGYGGATLAWWLSENLLPSGSTALTIADFLALELTGIAATDATHAASWGLLNLAESEWDKTLLSALGISTNNLPPLRDRDPLLGPCRPEAAERFGLEAGTVVVLPVGDNQASVFGAAGGDPKATVVNLGTGGQVSIPASSVCVADGLETRPARGGGYLHVGASLCGGWAYAYLARFFQRVLRDLGEIDLPEEVVYGRMAELVSKTAETSLRVDTRFAGTRDDPARRGRVAGIDPGNLVPGELALAFLEGMVRELADFAHTSGAALEGEIIATGNAARRNPAVPRVIERFFGRPCRLGPAREEAALGAALLALREIRA